MTPWTVAGQAPLSKESSRQEYWSGLPFPSPEDLPAPRNLPAPGIEPRSPALQANSFPSEPPGKSIWPHAYMFTFMYVLHGASQTALVVKNPPASAGDVRDADSIPGLERSPGEGRDNPFQYSCLENPNGQRSLVGYSPWGCIESDTTEVT